MNKLQPRGVLALALACPLQLILLISLMITMGNVDGAAVRFPGPGGDKGTKRVMIFGSGWGSSGAYSCIFFEFFGPFLAHFAALHRPTRAVACMICALPRTHARWVRIGVRNHSMSCPIHVSTRLINVDVDVD